MKTVIIMAYSHIYSFNQQLLFLFTPIYFLKDLTKAQITLMTIFTEHLSTHDNDCQLHFLRAQNTLVGPKIDVFKSHQR